MENNTVKPNPDINLGNATIVGTESGWVLPGGIEATSYAEAYWVAERMAVLMQGYVREGGL